MARRPNRPARIRPYFVKVLYKRFSKLLLIPRKYVSLHRDTLGKECVLWPTHTRDSFRVRTKSIDNELFFKKGWDAFAKHHSLKFGDLLIFRHVQNYEFHVDVLDMTGTLREPALTSENDQPLREAAGVPPNNIGRQKNITQKTAALTAAEALISSSEFASFKKIMNAADLKPGGFLYVPAHYAKVHMKDSTKNVQIEFSDKVWIVEVRRRRPGESRTFLSAGWSDLARESNLQVDDVCVFQLISTKDNTLKLTISRPTNAGRPKKTILQTGRPKKTILQTTALSAAQALVASSKFHSFKKIMTPAYVKSGGCLHVPEHFAKEHLRNSSRDVKIEFSDKACIKVLRRQPGEMKTFLGGWSDLARENSLQVDDVCVFQLINTKDCTLKLTIFRQTSGENQRHKQCQDKLKSRSSYSELTPKSKKHSKRSFDEAMKSQELTDKAFKCGNQEHRQLVEVKIERESSDSDSEFTLESKEPSSSDKALEIAKKFQSKSKHPSFVAVMRPSYIKHVYLHLPTTFVKEMGKKLESGTKVKLQSPHCELKAKMSIVCKQWRMNAGWGKMVKEESIKVDDVCVLELINRKDYVIKISIFRCNN